MEVDHSVTATFMAQRADSKSNRRRHSDLCLAGQSCRMAILRRLGSASLIIDAGARGPRLAVRSVSCALDRSGSMAVPILG